MAFKNNFGQSFGTTGFTEYGGGKNIWHEVKGQYPVGGVVDTTGKNAGDIIKAGTLMYLDMAAHKVVAAPSEFSTSTAYAVGDYCSKSGVVYKCKATHSAGAWAADDFEASKGGYGLVLNDLLVDAAAKAADGALTATLVYEGEIYASRTELSAANLALVPQIVAIYEA